MNKSIRPAGRVTDKTLKRRRIVKMSIVYKPQQTLFFDKWASIEAKLLATFPGELFAVRACLNDRSQPIWTASHARSREKNGGAEQEHDSEVEEQNKAAEYLLRAGFHDHEHRITEGGKSPYLHADEDSATATI